MEWTDKTVVITGSLRPMKRQEVVSYLKKKGAIVHGYVSDQTQVLIAGHKQLNLFNPDYRSLKYQAVLDRKSNGQSIEIMSEEDFFLDVRSR